jgi:predicted ester cyclase
VTVTLDETRRRRRERTVVDLLEIEQHLDFDRLPAVFPHPRYELIGNSRVYDGLEVCIRYLKERRSAFPDYRVEPIARYHAPEALIAEAWVTGTHQGRIEGIDPTGKGFRFRMATFFLFEGDRLTCVRNYFDHATIARQLA